MKEIKAGGKTTNAYSDDDNSKLTGGFNDVATTARKLVQRYKNVIKSDLFDDNIPSCGRCCGLESINFSPNLDKKCFNSVQEYYQCKRQAVSMN